MPRRPGDLDELLDREEIRNLIAHYMYAVDGKDWAAWVELLTDDVRLVHPSGSREGKEAAAHFAAAAAAADQETLHLTSGTVIEVHADTATARSQLRRTGGLADNAGVFSWTLRREEGEWRIAGMEYERAWRSDVAGLGGPHRRLLAEREIRVALDHYRAGMDGDPDRVLDAFHEDGTLAMGELQVSGSDAIRDAVAAVGAEWAAIDHHATNLRIAFEDASTATATSYGLGLFVASDGVTMSVAGRYRDRFESRHDVWRLERRDIELRHCAVSGAADVHLTPAAIDPGWLAKVRQSS